MVLLSPHPPSLETHSLQTHSDLGMHLQGWGLGLAEVLEHLAVTPAGRWVPSKRELTCRENRGAPLLIPRLTDPHCAWTPGLTAPPASCILHVWLRPPAPGLASLQPWASGAHPRPPCLPLAYGALRPLQPLCSLLGWQLGCRQRKHLYCAALHHGENG